MVFVKYIKPWFLYATVQNGDVIWNLRLDPRPAGGPYEIVLRNDENTVLQNVLFGDVWFCSGQSNMEQPMFQVN